jgi:hypothetical protein
VVYAKHPCSSVERGVVHRPEPLALLYEVNLMEVHVLFMNHARRAALRTNKDCSRHEGGEGNVGFAGSVSCGDDGHNVVCTIFLTRYKNQKRYFNSNVNSIQC